MNPKAPRLGAAFIAILGLAGMATEANARPTMNVTAYCRAHPNNDDPARAFYGPRFQLGTTPREVARRGANDWRCMDGRVWICNLGADGYACQKLSSDPRPSGPVRKFCAKNPGADFVPMVVIGDSATNWRCDGSAAVALETQSLDKRGFIAKSWRPLRP